MERKIKLTDFMKKEKNLYLKKNKIQKIYGIAGTGKTTYVANLIKENKEDLNNILIISYSHTGKNELVKKLTGKIIGDTNIEYIPYNIDGKIIDVSALTFFSFIYRVFKETNNSFLKKFWENYSLLIKEPSFSIKSQQFYKFIKKHNLNINQKKLIFIIDKILKRQDNPFLAKEIEELIRSNKTSLSTDEFLFLVLFFENNIYQHLKTKVFDFVNNKKYLLFNVIKEKWSSIYDREIDLDRLLNYRELILEDFPNFNINSLLKKSFDKINNPVLLDRIIRIYDLVIVDEAQDSPDYLLSYLFKLIDTDNLYLVGDPAQNIYFDLGYSEVFSKYDEENTVILKQVFRYSEDVKNYLLQKYPKFKLLRNIKEFAEYNTEIIETNKQKFWSFIKDKNYILIKNTNNELKSKKVSTLLLGKDIRLAFSNLVDLSYSWDILKNNLLDLKFFKRWLVNVLEHSEIIANTLIKNKTFPSKEKKENEKNLITDLLLTLRDFIINNRKSLDFIMTSLKNLFSKYNLKPTRHFSNELLYDPMLFINTYQSKGRSYNKIIYYNEFGKYFLIKKQKGLNYWEFYHATLEYVAYTRAKRELIIVK